MLSVLKVIVRKSEREIPALYRQRLTLFWARSYDVLSALSCHRKHMPILFFSCENVAIDTESEKSGPVCSLVAHVPEFSINKMCKEPVLRTG